MIRSFNLTSRWLGAALLPLVAFAVIGCSGGADVMNRTSASQRSGLALYNEGEYEDAAGSFRNALRTDPRDYKSHFYLGACYDAMKQYQLASKSYRTALDVMPLTKAGEEDKEFRLRTLDALATTIARGEEHASQISTLENSNLNTKNPEDIWLLAKVYRYTGDVDAALEAYNRATMLDKKNFAIAKEYGLYLEQLGQTQKAEKPLKRAWSLNSRDEQVNAALRRLGIVPGPSKDQRDLSQPTIGQSGGSADGAVALPDMGPAIQAPRE